MQAQLRWIENLRASLGKNFPPMGQDAPALRAIKSALACGGPVAVMPCCHHTSSYHRRPTTFDEALGTDLAIDIDRTYRLEGAGYSVEWSAIPAVVTPKNRIIIGRPGGPRRDLDYDPRI